MRLNQRSAAAISLDAGKAEQRFFDDELTGFALRVRAGGKKTWIIQCRVNGQARTYTIGDVGKIDADKARAEAKTKLAQAQLGIDPQTAKTDGREGQTLGQISDLYLAQVRLEASRQERAETTASFIEQSLTQHWAPFRSKRIDQITRADVATQLKVIEKERGPIAANRGRSYLSGLYSWAMGEGIAQSNPTIDTNRNKEKSRDRVLTDSELVEVWDACDADIDYGRIVRLLILTGQRKREVGNAMQDEIDTEERTWSIPKSRTKNGVAHEVPLSHAALAIFRPAIKAAGERKMLFGRLGTGFSGWSKAKAALDMAIISARQAKGDKTKIKPWTIHDLRRTFATGLVNCRVPPHIAEACLNHISGHKSGVAGVYNRATYRDEKRSAMDRWADHVTALVAGRKSSIPFKKWLAA